MAERALTTNVFRWCRESGALSHPPSVTSQAEKGAGRLQTTPKSQAQKEQVKRATPLRQELPPLHWLDSAINLSRKRCFPNDSFLKKTVRKERFPVGETQVFWAILNSRPCREHLKIPWVDVLEQNKISHSIHKQSE